MAPGVLLLEFDHLATIVLPALDARLRPGPQPEARHPDCSQSAYFQVAFDQLTGVAHSGRSHKASPGLLLSANHPPVLRLSVARNLHLTPRSSAAAQSQPARLGQTDQNSTFGIGSGEVTTWAGGTVVSVRLNEWRSATAASGECIQPGTTMPARPGCASCSRGGTWNDHAISSSQYR